MLSSLQATQIVVYCFCRFQSNLEYYEGDEGSLRPCNSSYRTRAGRNKYEREAKKGKKRSLIRRSTAAVDRYSISFSLSLLILGAFGVVGDGGLATINFYLQGLFMTFSWSSEAVLLHQINRKVVVHHTVSTRCCNICSIRGLG
jgi:hypothetical protein